MATSKKTTQAPPQKSAPDELQGSVATAPLFYADSLVSLALGPYVSKATLGQQVGGVEPAAFKATVTVVLPTNALLGMAKNILSLFSSPDLITRIGPEHSKLRSELEALTQKSA